MVNDPLLGYLTEKPFKWTKKWGLRAPWVVLTSIPVLLLYYFMFAPPLGAGDLIIFLWFIIITCLFDTFFSIFNDHVYSGYTNQFPSEYERRKSFAIASVFLAVGVLGMTVVSSAIIVPGDLKTYQTFAIISLIVMMVMILILFLGIKESAEMKEMFLRGFEKEDKPSFFKTAKTALTTKNFVVSLIGYTCQVTATTLVLASQLYMYVYVYELDWGLYAIPTIIGIGAWLGFIPFWSNYARKHGFKKTYWVAFVGHGLSLIPFLWAGAFTDGMGTVIEVTIYTFIMYAFFSGEVIMLMPVASDTYDLVATKLGQRIDATMVGVRTFFFRIAIVIQGVVFTVVSIVTLFDPDPAATTQLPIAVWGIRVKGYLIPAIIMFLMGLLFRAFYTLEGAEKEALVRKLKELALYR